jgi:hypothetical protein
VELGMTLSMAVNVLPCLGVGECQLGGHQAHDRAIFVVQLLDLEGPSSAVQTEDGEERRDFTD